MKRFILQHNAEGGATGVKVICADDVAITQTGGVLFIRGGDVVAAFASYAVVQEETALAECEVATQAWLAAQGE